MAWLKMKALNWRAKIMWQTDRWYRLLCFGADR